LIAGIETHASDKSQPVYLHCKGGTRSSFAALGLKEMGYQNVFSVDGGITEWEKCGYSVVKK
jgi:rhodanese-related sulfurtransferase